MRPGPAGTDCQILCRSCFHTLGWPRSAVVRGRTLISTEMDSAWTGLPGRVVAAALRASSSSADGGRIFSGDEEAALTCEPLVEDASIGGSLKDRRGGEMKRGGPRFLLGITFTAYHPEPTRRADDDASLHDGVVAASTPYGRTRATH